MKQIVIAMCALVAVACVPAATGTAAPAAPTADCTSMDLLFIIDDTADMSGAVVSLRASFATTIWPTAASLCGDVRFGLITFKDDVQVDLPFTSSGTAFQYALNQIVVGGGNNTPEASNEAMKEAFDVAGSSCAIPPGFDPLTWRSGSCRVAILVTSAPPGGCNDTYDTPVDSLDGLAQARRAAEAGIVMGTECDYGTSINPTASSLLSQYAAITQGAYGTTHNGIGLASFIVTAMSRCTSPLTIGWANLQQPPTLSATTGVATAPVYGQVWIDGVTNQPGATSGLTAELGYGPDGSDPSVDPAGWQWTPAVFNRDAGINDEFTARLTVSPPGTYDYCYRYSNRGAPWVYGDLDGSTNGYWPGQAGGLTVAGATSVLGTFQTELRLYTNQPNPFNPRTTIKYDLPEAGPVRLSVFDVAGRLVRTLVDDSMPPGSHEALWDGRDAAGREVGSGSYLARLEFGGRVEVVRMGLVR